MARIIIISYTFPPTSGIGGRRWAKFAKYFQRKGAQVQVLCGPVLNRDSSWTGDVEDLDGAIYEVSNPEGSALKRIPKTIVEKLQYRLALARAKATTKGNYFDATIFWGKRLVEQIERRIETGHEIIVASAGPFSYLVSLIELRNKYPNIKLVADFRDPWTSNETAYGYDEIGTERFEYEQRQEKRVLETFDAVVSVAEPMTKYFEGRLGKDDTQLLTVPNGFDPDERIQGPIRTPNPRLRIAFIGTLYNKTLRHVQALRLAIDNHGNDVEFLFCGDMSSDARKLLDHPNIKCLEAQPRQAAMDVLLKSDVALLMLTDDLTYSFSTKFCEYIQHQMPIWVISEDGAAPAYVTNHNLGRHSKPNQESIAQELQWWISNHASIDYNAFDDSSFNIDRLSDTYLELLKGLGPN